MQLQDISVETKVRSPEVAASHRQALPRSILALLFAITLLPHLAVALIFRSYPIALDDMFQYDMLARSLASGQGYRWYAPADIQALKPYLQQFLDVDHLQTPPNGLLTTFRPPGYPFFLALIYRLAPFADRLGNARLAQAILMALMAPAAALFARKVGMGRREAVFAGLAAGFYPILLLYPAALASEDLFIPLLLFGTLALLWAAEKRAPGWAVIPGVLLGLAMLTRSVLALGVLLAAGWLWRFGKPQPRRWIAPAVLLATAFGVCLPWAVRNTLIMGRPTFVESALGYQMYIGYHPGGDGSFVSAIAIQPLTILDDAGRDRATTAEALRFIQADPGEAAVRVVRRAAFFMAAEDRELTYLYSNNFFGEISQPWLGLVYLVIVLPWFAVGLFSVFGFLTAPAKASAGLVLLISAGYIVPHLLIIAEPRFHVALVPLLVPFAAWGYSHRREAVSRLVSTQPSPGAWAARLSLLALAAFWVWGFALHWGRLVAVLGPGGNMLRLFY